MIIAKLYNDYSQTVKKIIAKLEQTIAKLEQTIAKLEIVKFFY